MQMVYLFEKYLEEGLGVSFKGQGLKWNSAADVVPVVEAMDACRNMKYLELEGNSLGVEAAQAIGKALESHPELEIALWKDLFTTRLKDEIPKALKYLFDGVDFAGARIQRLDLSDNAIGPAAMPGLAPFFRTHSSFYIEELIVNNEGLGPAGGSTFANALLECLELSQYSGERILELKVFQCGRNRQENEGTKAWAKLFSEVGTLEEIHMPQNGINPPAINDLANAFRKNPNLRIITLEDNTIREDGAEMLREALPHLLNLEQLNLSDCLLNDQGAKHIANGIRSLTNLRSLELSSDEIEIEGGRALVAIIRTLPIISYVDLSGNDFGDEGSEEIERCLGHIQKVIVTIEDEEEIDVTEAGTDTSKLGQPVDDTFVATLFIENPSLESYKLLSNPLNCIVQLSHEQEKIEKGRGPEVCIYAATHISKILGDNVGDVCAYILDEALRQSENSNHFSTALLTSYGYIRPEKGRVFQPLICRPSSSTIRSLSKFLKFREVPVTVFLCLNCFINQAITADTFNILNSDFKDLISTIREIILKPIQN